MTLILASQNYANYNKKLPTHGKKIMKHPSLPNSRTQTKITSCCFYLLHGTRTHEYMR